MERIVVGITGASGIIYARQFLKNFPLNQWEVHAIISQSAFLVAEEEGGLQLPSWVQQWDENDLKAPCASGSNVFKAMVVIPCSIGTLGKIANGIADNLITRTAEVFLKERRKLILVTRETPASLIQIRNMETVTLSGAMVLPATPSFYSNPQTVEEVVNTVVFRIFDQIGIQNHAGYRWRNIDEK
jgi:4-hydroxy-3-polyprenylbenzoate decarboxylase